LFSLVSLRSIVLVTFAVTAAAGQQREPRISWVCDVKVDRERGIAKGTISLRAGSQLAVITDRPLNECYVIPQSRYQLFGIPSDAVTACHHGFGPSSEELYVLRRSAQLLVYRKRETDERRPEKPRLIKRIPYAEPTHLANRSSALRVDVDLD
jgi:hypothetical protein